MYSIEELKKLRKDSGLTQAEVARLTNFSQSLISQVESGEVDPRLSTFNKIYSVITQHRNKRQQKAIEIMKRDLISIKPNDTLANAIKLMKKYDISQLPVIENEKPIGSISDSTILKIMDSEKEVDIKITLVKEVMDEPFPIVSANTTISAVAQLLRENPALLVTHMGAIEGIITKADLLNIPKM